MLTIKATHNRETRRLVFDNTKNINYNQICDEVRRVFPIHGPFYLRDVSVTAGVETKQIPDIVDELQFETFVTPKLAGLLLDSDVLRFTIGEFSISPPLTNRVHTAPTHAMSSAWRSVDAPTHPTSMLVAQSLRQVFASQTTSPPNTNTIEASLNKLEKDFREGEEKFTEAFGALKSEVMRLLAQAHSTMRPISSSSASATVSDRAQGGLSASAGREDTDVLGSFRIPGAFETANSNTDNCSSVRVHAGDPTANGRIHYSIWCDYCGRAVRDVRAKCDNCEQYDLCEECVTTHDALNKHADSHSHTFTVSHLRGGASVPSPRPNISSTTTTSSSQPVTTDSNPQRVIHYGIVCDCCGETIVGLRNKCFTCFDYDLCERCLPRAESVHTPAHTFYTIERSEFPAGYTNMAPRNTANHSTTQRNMPNTPDTRVIHQATCDLCDSIIVGTRHKCLDCPDYDVCSACYSIVGEQHPYHVFVAVTTPQNLAPKNPARKRRHYATCDGCNKTIYNIRFKCMHPECPDYDLCEKCEALPITIHPTTHPLLKMRHPLTVIPTVYRVGGQTLVPGEHPKSEVPRGCPAAGGDTPKVTATPEQPSGNARGNSDNPFELSSVENLTLVATSEEMCNIERTPQLKPAEEVSEPLRDIQLTPPVTGRLSLEQMLSQPLATEVGAISQSISSSITTAAHTLLRALPSDMPTFELNPKQELRATFVSNNNVADGQVFPPGAEFLKSWRMVNDGAVAWPESTEVVFVAGDRLAANELAPNKFTVGTVEPNKEIDVSAGELKAPEVPGKYVGYWKLSDGSGRTFGQSMWCEIVVAEVETFTGVRSLASSEVIMPSSAASVATTIANTNLVLGEVIHSTPTTLSISSGTQLSDIGSDDSSALLEEFESESDVAEWEDIRRRDIGDHGIVDPEYVVLYDEDQSDDE